MSEIEIIKEIPITLLETKAILEKIEKRDKELNEKAVKTKEYINKVTKKIEIKEIKKKIEKLGITRLKPRHIAKIIDLMPQDTETLKALFTLKQE